MSQKQTPRADWFGAMVGFATFCGGVALLLITFKLAYDLFTLPPSQALGIQKSQAIDVARAGESLTTILMRMLLLLVMAAVGSMVANRGIKLYVSARSLGVPKHDVEGPEPPEGTTQSV